MISHNGLVFTCLLFIQFFGDAGFPCPEFGNPSDHFIHCINSDFDKVRRSMKLQSETDDDPLDKITAAEAVKRLVDSYLSSEYCCATKEKIEEMSKVVSFWPIMYLYLFCWD